MLVFLLLQFILYSVYAVFSYSLTDPNLVLSNWPPYWSFQTWMWQTFFHNPVLLSMSFAVVMSVLFLSFLAMVAQLFRVAQPFKWLVAFLMAAVMPLLLSYNALSHDVFNYIFNAKMVMVYHANPHVHVALDFAQDDWVRFMHNTHTPAPYGYTWTIFSLLPYAAGLNKFVPTWLLFRAWEALALVLLVVMLELLRRDRVWEAINEKKSAAVAVANLGLTLLHPLLLIEMISNSHNDLWMMVPALASLWLVGRRVKKRRLVVVLLAAILLAASISIKFASIVLLPIWLWLVVRPFLLQKAVPLLRWVDSHLAELASLAMLLPLLTLRSQQFHPWYFTWVLVWLPFIKLKWWRRSLLVLSFSSLFRYLPWLLAGNFEGQVLLHQKLITWVPFVVFCFVGLIFQVTKHKQTR